MRRLTMMLCAVGALVLAGCSPTSTGLNSNGSVSVSDQIALKSTTALSLAELAFNSAEDAATAAVKSGHLSKTDVEQLNVDVLKARSYRDQARMLVQEGSDASSVIESLNAAIGNIRAIAGSPPAS